MLQDSIAVLVVTKEFEWMIQLSLNVQILAIQRRGKSVTISLIAWRNVIDVQQRFDIEYSS